VYDCRFLLPLGLSLLVGLTACANTPWGQRLEDSLGSDTTSTPSEAGPVAPDEADSETPKSQPTGETEPAGAGSSEVESPNESEAPSSAEPESDATPEPITGDPDVRDQSPQRTFPDLDQAPLSLQPYLEGVVALGVLTPSGSGAGDMRSELPFQPNETVTRREYVRWLLGVNNHLYGDRPEGYIRPASVGEEPVFEDVLATDPDFPSIQGLAAAGLLPSRLSGDEDADRFGPDDPLTRATLLQWKVPVEYKDRSLDPDGGTVDSVEESWGFRDADQIPSSALGAVHMDSVNRDRANIYRAFGYTRLFQPQKPVSRAEAAATLCCFDEWCCLD